MFKAKFSLAKHLHYRCVFFPSLAFLGRPSPIDIFNNKNWIMIELRKLFKIKFESESSGWALFYFPNKITGKNKLENEKTKSHWYTVSFDVSIVIFGRSVRFLFWSYFTMGSHYRSLSNKWKKTYILIHRKIITTEGSAKNHQKFDFLLIPTKM